MAKKPKPVVPPMCCGEPARLTTGREVYPNNSGLHRKNIWKCDRCEGYVGCHGDTTEPLGTPAGPALRNARITLHNRMVDPLWKTAVKSGGYKPETDLAAAKITKAARGRVYAFLAHRMGLSRDDCHVSMFTIEQCREAWRALHGVTYPDIRNWYKAKKAAADEEKKDAA